MATMGFICASLLFRTLVESGNVLAVQKVLSGSGRAGRLRLLGKYIGNRLVARPELDGTFWTDSTVLKRNKVTITVESLQALYAQRERETFSDATCSCGLPTYRMRGSLLG